MTERVQTIVIGQGIAGSAVAWTCHRAGQEVVIVDRVERVTASKVAAGLVTPVTGKRLVQSAEFDDDWRLALEFYRFVERETGLSLFHAQDMIRLFSDEAARTDFLTRSELSADTGVADWRGRLQTDGPMSVGITISPAGRLDVPAYLKATQAFFEARSCYRTAEIDFDGDVTWNSDGVLIDRLDLAATQLVLCQGAQTNPLFPSVPNNPVRGDILTVRIPNYRRTEVVHRGLWIAPNADGTQAVGATYDWKNLRNETSECGRAEILGRLSQLVGGPVSVEQHRAAVRPTMKDYQPVIGQHPDYDSLFILNGLGSKGTLRAPARAADLLGVMTGRQTPPEAVRCERLFRTSHPDRRIRPLTALAQDAVRAVVQPGDVVIDATVGNGFDTCFLAESVGPTGHVIGFDTQHCAIEATTNRLAAHQFCNVELRHESHEKIAAVAQATVSAVMFNLGFLPRSDHTIVTQPESSTAAIAAAVSALKPGGVMTVLSYRGHDGGEEEYRAVDRLLSTYAERFSLQELESTPPKATSPILFVLRKMVR